MKDSKPEGDMYSGVPSVRPLSVYRDISVHSGGIFVSVTAKYILASNGN